MDYTQLHSVTGRPFIVSPLILPCFKMVILKTSVRASDDPNLQRIQEIARMPYENSPEITPSTYCHYGKKYPAKEASRCLVDLMRQRNDIGLREHHSNDVENQRYSHTDWMPASESTRNVMDQKVKEPRTLLFFRGAMYKFTFNEH
eukprot:15216369-Ditylum_brightwellii.AAC.1